MKQAEVPLRSHGSLPLNQALMAAGLVDFVQVTIFPVITGQAGQEPIFQAWLKTSDRTRLTAAA